MVCWLVATAVLTVWFVFRDPRFDYRLLVVGSVLPLVVDGLFGGARALHSVAVTVLVLAIVMAVTAGRKPVRRTLLGLPLGMLLYLVYSGAWADAEVFWWPFSGLGWPDAPLPMADRGWWNLVLEALGVVGLVWITRRAGLGSRPARRRFVEAGELRLDGGMRPVS